METVDRKLIEKYNVKGPRYTSYPTSPNWESSFSEEAYKTKLISFGQSCKSLSLYIHVPFCESRCYFCACSVLIHKSFPQNFQNDYIDSVLKEASLVQKIVGGRKSVKQFHIGGGTPSYLSIESLERLMAGISDCFDLDFESEIAIEIDPRFIDLEKLRCLKKLGFNRLSFGIQDFSEKVQASINRFHSFEVVSDLFKDVRNVGFENINIDLIYGLPNQTMKRFKQTIEQVFKLKPSRIALYSFAHIPQAISHQKLIKEEELPSPSIKLDLFMYARNELEKLGYLAIAMDHVALPSDPLAEAFENQSLHRNFMGYTTRPADEFIGLGYSSIGFLENTFIQNVKSLDSYFKLLKEDRLPVARGLLLSEDDRIRKWMIYEIMCHFKIDMKLFKDRYGKIFGDYFHNEAQEIRDFENEGFLKTEGNVISVTSRGKMFVRNIAMIFDSYLKKDREKQVFSKTV